MSIQPRSTDYAVPDDPSWLGSAHGLDSTQTITLYVSAFTAGTHYPNGAILSGNPLGKITATGLYGPYTTGAADGTDVLAGFLVGTKQVNGQTKLVSAILTHGAVREARLPFPVDAAGKADVAGTIRFI